MDNARLELDRFLRKDPNQTDNTKDATYAASNPAPKRGDDALRKMGRPKGSEEDDGAPNVLTGTVITSCFIQTSALPSRIELEGNDLTFFDDTFTQGGRVIGDTSRLIFTHGSGKSGEVIEQGFIMEKRASVYNTYDNVLSWYAVEPKPGAHNYMFIGRDARQENFTPYVHSMHFAINNDSDFTPPADNPLLMGIFEVEYFTDAADPVRTLVMGRSDWISPSLGGFSSVLIGGNGGVTVLGYQVGGTLFVPFYVETQDILRAAADLLPNVDSTYDIGSNSERFANIYADNIVTSSLSISSLTVTTLDVDTITVDTIQFVSRNVTSLSPGQMAYHDNAGVQQFRANAGGFFGSIDLTGV